MSDKIINGKAIANTVKKEAAEEAELLKAKGIEPHLAVVIVGEDPASKVYVRNKIRAAKKVGIKSTHIELPYDTSEQKLLEVLDELNADDSVHGILVQLPLPEHISESAVLMKIDPAKDVDGFTPANLGRLFMGKPYMLPCTPAGVIRLIGQTGINMEGKRAVIIGRSNIVGKPLFHLLLMHNATPTVCHSRTKDLPSITKQADILIAAVGVPKMVKADWVKKGAIVIDVGVNRLEDGSLAGDVDFDEVAEVASHITPVPGGVGPMTVAMLMKNTIIAARHISERL